jgi:RNA polymerase-binding transcription factor DksA
MSDTFRTDAAEYESQDEPAAKLGAVDVEFARTLERELNESNQIIRQQQLLEEELIDTKGQYAALVADVVLYEDRGERIKRLEEALRRIANADYRGNRSTESQIAFEALEAKL